MYNWLIIACFAYAIDENPSLNVCRKGSKHLILFNEVDVATPIERDMTGQKQPIVYIIRAANTKTFREIHSEIRAAQVEKVEQAWEGYSAMPWLQFAPMVLIRIFWWIFCWMRRTYPQVQKKYGGTVGVTAVGMFGKGAGSAIPINDHTIDLTLGSIASKPGVMDGQIAIREYLSMTLSFDHALIDGAPAARFTQRLKDLIESGYGLTEIEVEEPVIAQRAVLEALNKGRSSQNLSAAGSTCLRSLQSGYAAHILSCSSVLVLTFAASFAAKNVLFSAVEFVCIPPLRRLSA